MLTVDKYEEAAALVAAGEKHVDVAMDPALGRVRLTFDDSASDALTAHRAGKLQVSSLAMANALQDVKTTIFRARGTR